MRKILCLLKLILEALVDIAEEKTSKKHMSIDEAQALFDEDLISVSEYNAAFKRKH